MIIYIAVYRNPLLNVMRISPAFTYGYDSVTQMQETKVSLCRIEKA